MSVGERITELRIEKNITQNQLAKLMAVSRQAVSKWENDLSSPDTLNLIKLADVLDTDVEYLAAGRHSVIKAAPQVVTVVQPVEKIVEKPVPVEKIVEVERIVEKIIEVPRIQKVIRIKYLRNPLEFILVGFLCFLSGLIIGLLF